MTTRSRIKAGRLLVVAALTLFACSAARALSEPDGKAPEMEESVKLLQEDFLKLKFGMFLHYNMATYHGVQWVPGYPSPADFNPGGPVDTDAWADAAVSAGMADGVLTVKVVGGLCLWDSQ